MDTLDTFRKHWRFQRHILPLSHLWTFPRSASLRVVSLQHRSNNFSTGDNFAEKYFSSKYVNLIFSFLFYREFSVWHLIQYQQKKRLSERNLKRNSTQKAGIMADSRPGKSSYARLSPAFRLSLSFSLRSFLDHVLHSGLSLLVSASLCWRNHPLSVHQQRMGIKRNTSVVIRNLQQILNYVNRQNKSAF